MALNLEAPHSAADSDVFSNSSRVTVTVFSLDYGEVHTHAVGRGDFGSCAKAGTSFGTKVELLVLS